MIAIPPLKTPIPSPMPRPVPRPFQLDPSCVLYMDFIDKLSTEKAFDESAYSNHGTIIGATWKPDGLSFDGVDDYVAIPKGPSLMDFNHDFSICNWFKTSDTDRQQFYFMSDNSYDNYIQAFVNTDGAVNFYVRAVAGVYPYKATVNTYNDGNWHHFCFTWYDVGEDGYMYLDGDKEVLSDTTTGLSGEFLITTWEIGRDTVGDRYFWNGSIGEVAIFNRALTANEINNLYQLGKARLGI